VAADTGINLLAPFLDVKVKNFFSDSPVLPSVSSNSLSEASSLHDGAPTPPSEPAEWGGVPLEGLALVVGAIVEAS